MKSLSDDTLDTFLADNPRAVVMFGAAWCAPCKALKPKMQKMTEEFTDVAFGFCDVEDAPRHASELGIHSLPTLISFAGSKRTDTLVSSNEKVVREMVLKIRG
jgi:thioredoxin 1